MTQQSYKVADSAVRASIPGVKVDGHGVRPWTILHTEIHLTDTYKYTITPVPVCKQGRSGLPIS